MMNMIVALTLKQITLLKSPKVKDSRQQIILPIVLKCLQDSENGSSTCETFSSGIHIL